MERESNQLEAGPILCRTGCGFFGSPNTDGLCSKCYKDALKKKQQPPQSSVTSPTTTPSTTSVVSSAAAIITSSAASGASSCSSTISTSVSPTDSTSTAQPTVPSLSQVGLNVPGSVDKCEGAGAQASEVDTDAGSLDKDAAKKKKNKCQTCKKKVGLTACRVPGFTCRCGGLFCSVHRYSNEHRCTFDYRELGAEEIRRNNPVIKGEKIQKI